MWGSSRSSRLRVVQTDPSTPRTVCKPRSSRLKLDRSMGEPATTPDVDRMSRINWLNDGDILQISAVAFLHLASARWSALRSRLSSLLTALLRLSYSCRRPSDGRHWWLVGIIECLFQVHAFELVPSSDAIERSARRWKMGSRTLKISNLLRTQGSPTSTSIKSSVAASERKGRE